MSISIRTTVTELRRLVSPVLHLTGDPLPAPVIGCVRIRSNDGHLTADATDRYIAAVSRRPADVADGFDELIRGTDLATILRVIKPTAGKDVPIDITPDGDYIVVTAGPSRDSESSVLRFRSLGNTTPIDIWRLVAAVLPAATSEHPITVDARRLAMFQAATTPDVNPDQLPLVIRSTEGAGKPVVVACGDHFIGLLMPMRSVPEANAALLDQWRSLVSPTKKELTDA